MTPRRTATDLRALMAMIDNARALAGKDSKVHLIVCLEKALTFAGACEEAATLLDPLFNEGLDEEEQPERWRQALEHIEWAARQESAEQPEWRGYVGILAREALGREA